MTMKTNVEVLSSILKTTQMGQIGIRAVMDKATKPELKNALKSQLTEYDSIEQEAHAIAAKKNWSIKELGPSVKGMATMCAKMNLTYGYVDSKIAAMMIQGNTRGMIKGLKNSHHAKNGDASVLALAQKLLECEKANIQQMQGYV